ncbi:MAG TPA: DUF2142 domain-containing protein, partial [Candidatus Saccharimonadales bacterium]|nr:DUF2142 domain-containing protein [Candidatus Saccharimonadales bacterium]
VDSAAQWRYVLGHPLQVLGMILLQPFTIAYAGVYAGLVGVLTNRLIHLPIFIIGLLYVGLLAAGLAAEKDKKLQLDWRHLRLASAAVFFGTFVLIALALYVSFTQVGHPRVEGIQGRYFLPLLPLLAIWSPKLSPAKAGKFRHYTIPAVGLIIVAGLLSALAALL